MRTYLEILRYLPISLGAVMEISLISMLFLNISIIVSCVFPFSLKVISKDGQIAPNYVTRP